MGREKNENERSHQGNHRIYDHIIFFIDYFIIHTFLKGGSKMEYVQKYSTFLSQAMVICICLMSVVIAG